MKKIQPRGEKNMALLVKIKKIWYVLKRMSISIPTVVCYVKIIMWVRGTVNDFVRQRVACLVFPHTNP